MNIEAIQPVLASYTLGRIALDRSRRARLQYGSRVLPREADPVQPLRLAFFCGRGNRMSLLRCPLVRWLGRR